MTLFRPGSWGIGPIKLPEFGLTEAAGRFLGKPMTAQGGSNIFGDPRAQTPDQGPMSQEGMSRVPEGTRVGNRVMRGGLLTMNMTGFINPSVNK